MNKRRLRKILVWSAAVCFVLFAALCVHLYIVTHQKPDPNRLVMARIDFNQPIESSDAERISSWLYTQQGIDHVLCNSQSRIAVFTFRPAHADANKIIASLGNTLHYKASRYLPSAEELSSGCPVGGGKSGGRLYNLIKSL